MPESDAVAPFLKELEDLVEKHIKSANRWYSKGSRWPRYCFRISGLFVVIGSLLLPVLTAARDWPGGAYWPGKGFTLAAVSLGVAILSSLSTFFRWDLTWQSRMKASLVIRGLLANWELAMQAARVTAEPRENALKATQDLFEKTYQAINEESGTFFSSVKWPSVSGNK